MVDDGNSYFGHAEILARYSGLPRAAPIWGHLQHGWVKEDPFPRGQTLSASISKFVWNRYNLKAARAGGLKDVHAIGAPFAYLATMNRVPDPSARRGTIAYPIHTTELQDDFETFHPLYARELEEVAAPPVTVCLFFRDFDHGLSRQAYEERGFRVICHGTRYDTDFPVRQFEELSRHEFAVANEPGSAVLYAGLLGCRIAVHGPRGTTRRWWAATGSARIPRLWPELHSRMLTSDESKALSQDELGVKFLRAPQELREMLGWSGWLHHGIPIPPGDRRFERQV